MKMVRKIGIIITRLMIALMLMVASMCFAQKSPSVSVLEPNPVTETGTGSRSVNSLVIASAVAETPLIGYEFNVAYNDKEQNYFQLVGRLNKANLVIVLDLIKYDPKTGIKTIIHILKYGEGFLPGIPYPNNGLMNNVYVWISGVTKYDTWLGFGQQYYDVIAPKTTIIMMLKFDDTRKVLYLPDGKSGDIIFIDGEKAGFWDDYYGAFVIFVNLGASNTSHAYQVYDSSGNLVSGGQLDQFYSQIDGSINQTGMMVNLDGGVVLIGPHSSSGTYTIDGLVTVDNSGKLEPAKVFVIDMSLGGNLETYGNVDMAVLYLWSGGHLYEVASTYGHGYLGFYSPQKSHFILVVYGASEKKFNMYYNGGKG